MAKPPHLPSFVGCAIGFAAAGCGVGSLVGTALGHHLYPFSIYGQGPFEDWLLAMYGGTQLGMAFGAAIGMVAGVLYAVLVRQSRLRRPSPDAEPGAAADTGPL
jgi:hypothetical protein